MSFPPAAILLSFVGPALVLILCFNALARRAGLRPRGLTWRIVPTLLAPGILIAPMRGLPLARWLAGVADHWSVPLLALLVSAVSNQLFGVELLRPRDRRAAWLFGAGAGLFLYPLALGLGPFDPFGWGWRFGPLFVGVAALATVLLWRRNRLGLVLVLAVAAWHLRVPESGNYWDCLEDPFYFLASLGAVGWWLARLCLPRRTVHCELPKQA
jgi:hypothetical protein